jgi:hypothetical protein
MPTSFYTGIQQCGGDAAAAEILLKANIAFFDASKYTITSVEV